MAENTKPAAGDENEETETPEVQAHAASVLDLQALKNHVKDLDGSCVSVLSVVLSDS
ncbi:hypothetical protein ACWEQL_09860 [Kitasatospora sp. NPDC004240]